MLDFNNPENWKLKAMVWHYDVSLEFTEDYYSEIISDVLSNNSGDPNNIAWWDAKTAKENCIVGSRYHIKGTCDHCGAHFNYGAAYEDCRNGQIAIVGNRCAFNNLCLNQHEYQDKKLRKVVKAAKTRIRNKILRDKREKEIESLGDEVKMALNFDHPICKNIKSNYLNWGNITPNQENLILKILREHNHPSRECNCKKPQLDKDPIWTGKKQIVIGKILGFKQVENHYSRSEYDEYTMKMIVEDQHGFKVYGTVPSGLKVDKNDIVKFTANLQQSDNDEYFGFFSRPRKASILAKSI